MKTICRVDRQSSGRSTQSTRRWRTWRTAQQKRPTSCWPRLDGKSTTSPRWRSAAWMRSRVQPRNHSTRFTILPPRRPRRPCQSYSYGCALASIFSINPRAQIGSSNSNFLSFCLLPRPPTGSQFSQSQNREDSWERRVTPNESYECAGILNETPHRLNSRLFFLSVSLALQKSVFVFVGIGIAIVKSTVEIQNYDIRR